MLKTLGYRIPAASLDRLLGEVAVQPWNDSFASAWQDLPQRSWGNGRPTRPAYYQLRTGLAAVHGRPVHIVDEWKVPAKDKDDGVKGMIISAGTISPFHLSTSLRTFERLLRDGDDRNSLAPLLTPAETTRRFSDYVSVHESGTADAPGWLFETATWAVMSRLAQPLMLEDDGPALALRLDTDGSLLTWDRPIGNDWGTRTGHAMLRIRARIVTLPQVPDLAIVFDAHLSRVADQWRGNKTAWIGRNDPSKPVLRVPIRTIRSADTKSGWSQEIKDFGAAIAESCGVEPLSIDEELTAMPGRVRPLISKPGRHPVGKGPGARVMLRLAEHIDALCPELEPLTWSRDPRTRIRTPQRQVLSLSPVKKTELPVSADMVAAAISAADGGQLHLLCLYSTSEARSRMGAQLQQLTGGAAPTIDGEVSLLGEGFNVTFHRVVELLRHGDHRRTDLLGDIEKIAKEATGTLLALVETEYDAEAGKPKDDAKNPVKRLLASHGIAAQFIATAPPDEESVGSRPAATKKKAAARQKVNAAKDYAASSAAADLLLRNAGVIHPKLANGILGGFLANTATETVQLVGLHLRSQSGQPGAPRMVATAVAIEASTDADARWPVRMWNASANSWTSYPRATASFHAGEIGSRDLGRSGQKRVDTRLYVESLMNALPAGPVVLFVDAESARGLWPGLQNQLFGDALLPAVNLSMLRDVAIVRCNASRETPRPVDRAGGHQPADSRQPAAPDRSVYRESDSNIWLFPKSSRVYRSKGGALGARYTPWTLPDNLRHLLKEDWHAYTGTEIAIPKTGMWDEIDLVTLTARLCDHTLAWDDRTVAPLPLHLASRADLTHPDYRSDDQDD